MDNQQNISIIPPIFHPGRTVIYKEKSEKFKEYIERKRKEFKEKNNQPIQKNIKLINGEILYFDESLPLLLTSDLENDFISRKLIQLIPKPIKQRLLYFTKFLIPDDIKKGTIEHCYFLNLRNRVFRGYYKEYILRHQFIKLLQLYRIYKLNKEYQPEIDPITLSPPEKEVIIYDWVLKRKYVFDARSLANSIHSSLTYSEYMFSAPQKPKNPKSNTIFTYSQLISIYYQLAKHQEIRWTIETLKESNFQISTWHIYNKPQLYKTILKNELSTLESIESKELFLDFVEIMLEECKIEYDDEIIEIYNYAINNEPTHWYIQKLKPYAILYNEYQYFNLYTPKQKLSLRMRCSKLFAIQNKFIEEFSAKKYRPISDDV